jgi:hypothetical protein
MARGSNSLAEDGSLPATAQWTVAVTVPVAVTRTAQCYATGPAGLRYIR